MNENDSMLSKIIAARPSVHPTRDGKNRCIGMHSDALRELANLLEPRMVTLETGCGLSTMVFAAIGCHHTAIVPNPSHIEATRKSALSYQQPMDEVTFIEGRSEEILPNLDIPVALNVILIDGGHAFPIPFIDWFYSSRHLANGGFLVIDDVDLKTVNILFDFLTRQPEWEKIQLVRRAAFFRKVNEIDIDREWDYWNQQPFNKDLGKGIRKLWLNLRYR